MNDSTTTFLKKLKGITLSYTERLAMRERLVAYADMHPLVEGAHPATSGFFAWIGSRRFSAYAMSLLAVVVISGGVTLAADTSVPGDSLYQLKIHVNEPLMTAFAPTATGQAKVAADIAARRVDEAVTLASRGQLTPERKDYLEAQFTSGVEEATKKADALATSGDTTSADTVRADLAAHLAGEAQALGAVKAKDDGQRAKLLRVVVATSDSIAGGTLGSYGTSPVSVEAADSATDATSTTAAPEVRSPAVAALMKTAQMATTTPVRTFTLRVNHQLRVASTTFSGRFASSTLTVSTLMAPKVDVAIPQESKNGKDELEQHR